MFLRRIITIFSCVFICLFAFDVLSYDNIVMHPKLTEAAINLYDNVGKLSQEQKDWIIQGSIDEDTDPRYLNHYYNPITGGGLDDVDRLYGVVKKVNGLPAKYWAKNQSNWVGFSGDYSESAILKNYEEENYKRAYQGIGHILHLVQDMAVPAHTRNDSHAMGDPYEGWAKNHGVVDKDKINFIAVNNLDQAFDELAIYSNRNFFSKDTIELNDLSLYKVKDELIDGQKRRYMINKIDNIEFRLTYSKNPDSINPVFEIDDDLNLNFDYWNMLHPKAVGYSAGVIDYFIKEFEKIDRKRSGIKTSFLSKVKSGIFSLKNDLKYGIGDIVSASGIARQNIGNKTQQIASAIQKMPVAPPFVKTTVVPQVNIDQQVAKVVPIAKDIILPKNAQGAVGDIASSSPIVNDNAQLQPAVDAPIAAEQPIAKNTPTSTPKDMISPLPQPSIVAPKSSFIPIYSNPYLELDTKILEATGAISSSTSADFIFYSTQTSDFEYNLNNAGWQQSQEKLALTDLAQGENTIEVRAVKKGEADPTPAIFRWQIDSIAPEINFGIRPDDHANSTSSIFKFSSNEIVSYECDINNAGWKACEGDLNIADLKEGEQILVIKASDGFGNNASSTSSWLVDLGAPTSTLSLDAKYYESDFSVNWSGNDSGSTTQSGVESFNVDYRLENGEWQEWLRNSTSTSAVFTGNYGNIIYFRSQAKDRAGNFSSWSEEKRTEIINPIADHIVISQIQVSGNSANDEFVELYNPTNNSISLAGYKLKRKTASGQEYNLVPDFGAAVIAAKSYYLIAHPSGFISSTTPDIFYSSAGYSIASDNAVILYDGTSTIDKIGFGAATDYEGVIFSGNPGSNQSLIRRNTATSTVEFALDGSRYDTDNNANDFLLNMNPIPRNSNYVKEKNRIKIDNITSAQNDWEMSFAWNHEIKNSDSMLLVLVHSDNDIDSVSYGGEGMILIAENMRHAPFNNLGSYIYALANPPQGIGGVVVDAAAQASMNATAISLSNHDIANPFAYIYSERSEGRQILYSTGTTTNGLIIDSVTYNHFENDLAPDDGQTEFYNSFRTGQTNNLLMGDSYKFINTPNETMGWNISRDAAYVYDMIVVKGK